MSCLSGGGKDESFGEEVHLFPELFGLCVLDFDLSSARVAPAGAGHDFDVGVLALTFFDGLHYLLDVPEPVALRHLHPLPLPNQLVFDKVAVSHLFPTHTLALKPSHERLEVAV